MMISLGQTTFKLEQISSEEFIQRINDYLLNAPSNSSLGNPEFAAGNVSVENENFRINPFYTGRTCLFPISSFGRIRKTQNQVHIDITFKSNPLTLFVLLGFFAFVAASVWNVDGASFLFIFFGVPMAIGALFERRHYLKSAKRHIEFLKQFDGH